MKNIQRELKVRVWNKSIYPELLVPTIISLNNTGWINITKETNGGIDLYTGLKDKNGVEIYEGDICKRTFTDEDKVYFGKIVYNICSFQWLGIGDQLTHAINSETVLEVIGNIYENPELLEDKK